MDWLEWVCKKGTICYPWSRPLSPAENQSEVALLLPFVLPPFLHLCAPLPTYLKFSFLLSRTILSYTQLYLTSNKRINKHKSPNLYAFTFSSPLLTQVLGQSKSLTLMHLGFPYLDIIAHALLSSRIPFYYPSSKIFYLYSKVKYKWSKLSLIIQSRSDLILIGRPLYCVGHHHYWIGHFPKCWGSCIIVIRI